MPPALGAVGMGAHGDGMELGELPCAGARRGVLGPAPVFQQPGVCDPVSSLEQEGSFGCAALLGLPGSEPGSLRLWCPAWGEDKGLKDQGRE